MPVSPPPATTTVPSDSRSKLLGEQHRVLRGVQRVGELVNTRDDCGVGDAAQRIDQGVVAQRERIVDPHRLGVGVDARHPALDEVHAGAGQPIGNLEVGQRLA